MSRRIIQKGAPADYARVEVWESSQTPERVYGRSIQVTCSGAAATAVPVQNSRLNVFDRPQLECFETELQQITLTYQSVDGRFPDNMKVNAVISYGAGFVDTIECDWSDGTVINVPAGAVRVDAKFIEVWSGTQYTPGSTVETTPIPLTLTLGVMCVPSEGLQPTNAKLSTLYYNNTVLNGETKFFNVPRRAYELMVQQLGSGNYVVFGYANTTANFPILFLFTDGPSGANIQTAPLIGGINVVSVANLTGATQSFDFKMIWSLR